MHSIRTKITAITVCIMAIAMVIVALLGVVSLRDVGNRNASQTLLLLCETGQKNLNNYFEDVEQSVEMISDFVESDLTSLDDEELQAHLDRTNEVFKMLTNKTNGILTYYYRIDPSVSDTVDGFWYVNLDGKEFKKHKVTDITLYDTDDTTQLVWYTVPKATGKGVWLPPYITDNLDARVLSYNVPVYSEGMFIGVIGIELDYTTMADEVKNITLYDNGYAFLNDEEGKIIYHPLIDVTTIETQPSVPKGLLSDDKFIFYYYGGVEKQAVWLPLSNGMRLNVTVPMDEINAVWHKWIAGIAASFVLLLGICGALIMTLVGKATKPLRDITNVAEQISLGNYDCELDYDKKDEIGTLAKTFSKVSTNIKQYISELNTIAHVDPLTGVRNRLALREDYDSYKGHDVTVMMMDMNNFKDINDSRGHDEGDWILRETGKLLTDTFGRETCYRYGGDEFVVIVPDMPEEEFLGKLEFLNQNAPTFSDSSMASFSIGYARAFLDSDDTLRALIKKADVKMYEVKRSSKGEP